jgi:hypothetical protein
MWLAIDFAMIQPKLSHYHLIALRGGEGTAYPHVIPMSSHKRGNEFRLAWL